MAKALRTRRSTHQFDVDGGRFDDHAAARSLAPWMIAFGTLAAATLVIVGFLVGGGYRLTPTSSCDAAASDLGVVSGLLAQGQLGEAGSQAHLDLQRSHLCRGVPYRFALAAYQADVGTLLTTRHEEGDIVGEEQLISRWRDTVRFARRYRLQQTSAAQLEQLAYSLGYWDFARVLWAASRDRVGAARNHFYSVLVNDGRETALAAPPRFRRRGLALLVLAHRLAHSWNLPRAEADVILGHLVGGNPRSWPAPFPSKLLPSSSTSHGTIHRKR